MTGGDGMEPASLLTHLVELRGRLLYCLATIATFFGFLFFVAADLYEVLAIPLVQSLGEGGQLIATEMTSPLLSPLKLAFTLSVYLAMPVILYHVWSYVAPGLYKRERAVFFPLLLTSCFLFYGGMLFCYFVTFPILFQFFQSVRPSSVAIMPDIHHYLSFALKLFFSFGLLFQVPVVVVSLVCLGVVSCEQLARKRRHVILAAFTVGMLLTPPDIVSQTLLALPVCFLFEIGLLVSRWLPAKHEEKKTSRSFL